MASSDTGSELKTPAGHYTFVSPSPGRKIMMITLMFTVLGLVYTSWQITRGLGEPAVVATIVLAVFAVAQWALLQTYIPQRIDIDKSVVTINRNGRIMRYDLVDPGLEIRVRDGEIAFAHYMEPWFVVRAKDVKWHVFIDVLMHYQSRADINADLRDRRFQR